MYYLYFAISSLLTFVLLRRRGNKLWGSVGSAITWLVGGIVLYILNSRAPTLGPGTRQTWWVEAILFVVLLLGMTAKYLWDLIEARNERNAKRPPGEAKVGLDFDFWDFAKPLLVSVIVFAAVTGLEYKLSKTALINSFQNGFFWQTIFKKKN
jgi:hypothetical protein